MAKAFKEGDCVRLPDGRIGRSRVTIRSAQWRHPCFEGAQ